MSIRTTVSLDEDVMAGLKEMSRSSGVSFKAMVNELLRTGMIATKSPRRLEKVTLPVFNMGACLLPSLDNIGEVIEQLEGENWR